MNAYIEGAYERRMMPDQAQVYEHTLECVFLIIQELLRKT